MRKHRLANFNYLIWSACCAVVFAASFGASATSFAQVPIAASQLPACASDGSVLGVSRIVEIDTTGGPHFGGEKGARVDFLADQEIVLTFDDGPLRAYTRRVLAALADHCTLGTFFMVGRMAAADPAMVSEVAARGHTIATHTWSHKNLGATGTAKAKQDFELGISAITLANGRPIAPFFRFPYLSDNKSIDALAQQRNIANFWIDIDSKDYLSKNASAVHRRVMSQLDARRRGIILFHDIQPSTVGAIKGLLDEMHRKGYKVVHIVPKAGAETVAEFDDAAEKLFSAKAKIVLNKPLADRSVVWPVSPSGAGAGNGVSVLAQDEEELPWAAPKAKPVVKKAKPKVVAPDQTNSFPWTSPFFDN
jgi:peptidoglycan/xylan/chitin deacetylase (PgdA/CDA1 family)